MVHAALACGVGVRTAAYGAGFWSARIFTPIIDAVGIRVGEAASPFPGVAGHIQDAIRTSALRKLLHRAGGKDVFIKITALGVGRLVAPGPEAGVFAARGLFPFLFGR